MIKTACKKPQQIKESPGNNAAQLRLLRNTFLKQYVQKDRELSSEQLTALLLYFALRFLEQNNGLPMLIDNSKLANKTIVELTGRDLFSIGTELFNVVQTKLPVNLRQVMVIPNKVSWQEAKTFFEKRTNDFVFADIANLGFAYQIFSLGMRAKQALPALQKADKKISRQELIAFTQLYTPNWVVDFLIANTVLPSYSKEGISKRYLQWLITDNDPQDKNQIGLSKLSLLDPACGSGQFLFSAFDLLMELAEQGGHDSEEAAKIILSENIFGADIDERALWIAGLGLTSKCLLINNSVSENLFNLSWVTREDLSENIEESDFLGSIDKRLRPDHFLKNTHKVIVTNPPYLGRKCLSRELKSSLKEQYPKSSNDLAAAFIERCVDMLEPGGRFGVITQASLLAIPSYQSLREHLISNYHLATAVRCGPGVFPLSSGEKIDSLLLLLNTSSTKQINKKHKTCFIDLSNEKEKEQKLVNIIDDSANGKNDNKHIIFTEQNNMQDTGMLFSGLPSNLSKKMAQFPKLGDIAEIRQGLATTDNARFVRYHFDVDKELIGTAWMPYIKGAGGQRYAAINPFVVKWADNGREIKEAVIKAYPYLKGKTAWVVKNEEYYFRPGLCFSFINKEGLAVRRLPAGAIFDVASSAIFAAPKEEDFLLAYLNSTFVGALAKAINQSINLQVGDLKKIPIIPFDEKQKQELAKLGQKAFITKEKILTLENLTISDADRISSARDLNNFITTRVNSHNILLEDLNNLQISIDKNVLSIIGKLNLIDADQMDKLYKSFSDLKQYNAKSKVGFREEVWAYKLLQGMIARAMEKNGKETITSIPVSKKSLAELFNISLDVIDSLEYKLETSLEEIFCQAKVVDISKLAQEASRYFSFYSRSDNQVIFFSALVIRAFLDDKAYTNLDKKFVSIVHSIEKKLQSIEQWTSKDLFNVFELCRK